jgi:hypothetical protein
LTFHSPIGALYGITTVPLMLVVVTLVSVGIIIPVDWFRNSTVVLPAPGSKLLPVIVKLGVVFRYTIVGVRPVIVGAATYMNWSAAEVADVPSGVVTVTSTGPGELAGLVVLIILSLTITTLVAEVFPKFTAFAPVKPVPVMITAVPPDVEPDTGVMPVIVGAGAVTRMYPA